MEKWQDLYSCCQRNHQPIDVTRCNTCPSWLSARNIASAWLPRQVEEGRHGKMTFVRSRLTPAGPLLGGQRRAGGGLTYLARRLSRLLLAVHAPWLGDSMLSALQHHPGRSYSCDEQTYLHFPQFSGIPCEVSFSFLKFYPMSVEERYQRKIETHCRSKRWRFKRNHFNFILFTSR